MSNEQPPRRRAITPPKEDSPAEQPRPFPGPPFEMKLVVTWGAQKFAPINYHTLDVGPITLETVVQVRSLDELEERHRSLLDILHKLQQQQVERELQAYLENIKTVAAGVRGARG